VYHDQVDETTHAFIVLGLVNTLYHLNGITCVKLSHISSDQAKDATSNQAPPKTTYHSDVKKFHTHELTAISITHLSSMMSKAIDCIISIGDIVPELRTLGHEASAKSNVVHRLG
jgi:hypothetical protein